MSLFINWYSYLEGLLMGGVISISKVISSIILLSLLLFSSSSFANQDKQDAHDLDLGLAGTDFQYLGAFRFPSKQYGATRLSYINGNFTIDSRNQSVFIAGHQQVQAIAEFSIPELSMSTKVTSLRMSQNIQPFSAYLKIEKRLHNPQKLNRITGMELVEGELFVNAIEYYDAKADNRLTTFIVRDVRKLASSKVDGFFKLSGAVHSAGWMSKLSAKWSKQFMGSYLHGHAGNFPINARSSMGPSAFVSYLDSFAGVDVKDGLIPARKLMDFSISNPMMKDLYNKSGKNDIWTELSNAYYGFIIPDTDYYLVLGNSGGHDSKAGYKATQITGRKCGGPCAYDPRDYYNYYWVFDVNDFIKVQDKQLTPWSLKPIKYGKLNLPFQVKKWPKNLVGADFDETTDKLYILLENADATQNKYEIAPVMLVYKLAQ